MWTRAGCTPFAICAGPSSRYDRAGGEDAAEESGEKLHSGEEPWGERRMRMREAVRGGSRTQDIVTNIYLKLMVLPSCLKRPGA